MKKTWMVGLFVYLTANIPFLACAQVLTYTKQQLLFLKWGVGDGEIGMKETKVTPSHWHPSDTDYITPFTFGVDGEENIYILDLLNRRILVYSKKGEFLRKIETDQTTPNMLVGDDGDVYWNKMSKDYKKFYTVRVTKNKERFQYPGLVGEHVLGNKIYDGAGTPVVVMGDKKNEVSPLKPPRLFEPDIKIERFSKKTISISTSKLKKYLKTKNISLNVSQIDIPIENKAGLSNVPYVLGVDEKGEIFIWYGFGKSPPALFDLTGEKVYVYSSEGKLITSFDVELNELKPEEPFPFYVKLGDKGDVFHMWVSKEGVYIYKWSPQ
jgi:hypothetical protein